MLNKCSDRFKKRKKKERGEKVGEAMEIGDITETESGRCLDD